MTQTIMMTLRKIHLLIGVIGCFIPLPQWSNAVLNEACITDADCGSDECCSMEPIRYATPSCKAQRKEGEQCIPGNPMYDSEFIYPDNSRIPGEGVHYVVCPCANNLPCSKRNGVCSKV